MDRELQVVMLGATGAVGGHVVRTLIARPEVSRLTLLGRRPVEGMPSGLVGQHSIDVMDASTYRSFIPGHTAAVCTLGVGQPSKTSRDQFVAIDKTAVLSFASACMDAGVRHFSLLGSVGADSTSRSFYLRTKGELEDELKALHFERLSLFRPSMILTPTNRYGFSQALTLAVWPLLRPLLVGGLRIYRGIEVERLGRAIALNLLAGEAGVEALHWDEIEKLAASTGWRPPLT